MIGNNMRTILSKKSLATLLRVNDAVTAMHQGLNGTDASVQGELSLGLCDVIHELVRFSKGCEALTDQDADLENERAWNELDYLMDKEGLSPEARAEEIMDLVAD